MADQALPYQFDDVRVDPAAARVMKGGRSIQLEPKAFRVLVFLIENRGRLVEKEELLTTIWGETFVTENALAREIALIRKLLRDDARKPKYIETVATRGYRFVAEVELTEPKRTGPRRAYRRASVAVVVAVGLLVAAAIIWSSRTTIPARPSVTKFVVTPPPDAPLADVGSVNLAISPDGERIVYVAERGDTTQLYVRPLDELQARPIPGTEGAETFPFFSPDGQSVGFFADGALKRVSLSGGPPITLCTAGPRWLGGAWVSEGMIVFSSGLRTRALYRVSATGGEPERLAIPDPAKGEFSYHCPKTLPGGKAVLFDVARIDGPVQIKVLSLETGEQKIVVGNGINAYYAPTGHLVYQEELDRVLMVVPFDLTKLEVTGDAVPLTIAVGRSAYVLSASGTLAYVAGVVDRHLRNLFWVDRKGTERLVTDEKRWYHWLQISPDGKQVALDIPGGRQKRHIWIYEFEDDSLRQLTFGGINSIPHWTPDGGWIAFSSRRNGAYHLYRQLADGSGAAERLTTSEFPQWTNSWSPDGSLLTFTQSDGRDRADIWTLPMDGDTTPRPLITSPDFKCCSTFSPDGQWLAYVSLNHGAPEDASQEHLYVARYAEPHVKWLVSAEEARLGPPVWSSDGTQLFYLSGGKVMAVPIETKPTFKAGKPRVLFQGPFHAFDISADGQRFLVVKKEGAEETEHIKVTLNWFEELKGRVHTDN